MKKQILFFPSAWSNEAVFAPQIEALKNQYEVLSPNIHQFDTIEAMSDFVVSNYKNVYALIGLSLGGFIVQDILSRYPNFASKAVLMGTYCHEHDIPTKNFYQGLIDQVEAGDFEKIIPLFTNSVISKSQQENQSFREKVSQLPRLVGQRSCVLHHKACISWSDHTDAIKNIKADTLILAGEEDKGVPLTHLQKLHDLIPNSTLQIVKHAGHLMTLEQPEQVNQILTEFLGSIQENK